jgi:hypothetical protein
MARIAGIKLHKTPKGKLKSVTISMKHHAELVQPLLEKVGAVEEDDFDRRFREGYTVEEVFDGLIKKINDYPWKK